MCVSVVSVCGGEILLCDCGDAESTLYMQTSRVGKCMHVCVCVCVCVLTNTHVLER